MLTIREYVLPKTVEEAYTLLMAKRTNTLIGGCTFLHLGSKNIHTAVDLSSIDLAYIREAEDSIEVGAMATFRDLERSNLLRTFANGVLPRSVKNILGIQFRNMVTVGATVFARYGFSDFITALLVLDTDVVLYKAGRMPLAAFLQEAPKKDLLEKVIIRKTQAKATFQDLRNSCSDFSIINAAVSQTDGRWKIAIGARPCRAKLAEKAAQYLEMHGADETAARAAAHIAVEEMTFGTNMRGSADYRKTVAEVLVRRCIMEVRA